MHRELLMMQNSFQWGTAEGQTLEIENAMRSNIRDLKIEGQTYQNLVDGNNVKLGNYSYNAGTGEYSLTNPQTDKWNELLIRYTRPVYDGEKLLIRVNIIKNTIVTTSAQSLKIAFSGDSNVGQEAINISNNYTGIFEFYCNSVIASVPDNIRISTRAYTSGELVIKDIQVIPVLSNPLSYTDKTKEYVSTESKFTYIFNSEKLKANTTYTLGCEIKSSNKITTNNNTIIFRVEVDKTDKTTKIITGFTGTVDNIYKQYKLTFNTGSDLLRTKINLRNQFNAPGIDLTENTLSVRNLVLLEGDYTNRTMIAELPTSINGIESVAERETNVLQIAQSSYETDGITLPNGVKNTIENGVYIRRIGKYTITGNEYYELRNENDSMFKIQCGGLSIEPTFGDYVSSDVKMMCDKAICEFCGDLSYVNNSLVVCGRAPEFKGFIIAIPKSLLSEYTIDKAKEYIKSLGGLTVWYQLATPITESIALTEIPLPQPLRSLPNGVCDEVVGNKLIQRVGVQRLDGSENWEKNEKFFVDKKSDINKNCVNLNNNLNNQLSNIKVISWSVMDNHEDYGINFTYFLRLNLKEADASTGATIEDLKNYLSSNPIYLYYELATPIEHTINVPPISISKGTNIVTTNNNIKPNLSIKYKKTKKKKPIPSYDVNTYLYNAGNEYLNITGGWNTQLNASYGAATTIVKNANNIYFPTGVWNMLLTNNKIDVTNYDVVYMKYSKEYSPTNFHPARCAIKLGNENTSWTAFADDATTGALIGKDETENNVTNGILTIDVSDVTGSYYVGIGGQSNNITVHEIGLKKENSDAITLYSNGNECVELTGGYLTSSNNSATCNIEKQADNLYVNCTGKQSFDSICYARTNKTIKPCKIKVSVKNNYISANGVAFCMFLSEKETITTVGEYNSIINKRYIKASNTTQNEYIDLEMDLTDNTEGYFYVFCMAAGSADYTCKANIRKIEIIRWGGMSV